ncbi:aconitate hydratase [Nitrosomonas eutropha]|uniref:Aconitate hydratase A n=2 Tax=Nitrosomonas eutropha TaxID=916 RepID=A0ABX5M680_9PROT|nr:aconitate hydratase [Nitrosomonas eutropha]ABI60665.1 aconitase [Nitrosomonas eutropha C91]PXV80230.1 aconitase [Nitrosomonas eutropha]SEI90073.1 aconitase [Nitrosomonas eutropha]
MAHNLFNSLSTLPLSNGETIQFYSLPALEAAGLGTISRLPVSIRIILESILRNYDDKKITEAHVKQLASWQPRAERTQEIPFVVARIVLQDFTGIPLLVDLAAMRSVAKRLGKNPELIEPLVPVDLVVDHSIQIDYYGDSQALARNMEIEFQRNRERYQFIKWGMQAFDTFGVVPPGIGIVHQVNLEYLARGVHQKDGFIYPDTLVGTDSHTTMINGIGVVGWGVGGIEAEAGMLGQPIYFLTPDVVGVNLTGHLQEGVTATDLVLTVTEMLRRANVVGKFVEFFGEGVTLLSLPDRATIANMAPEYGATMGFFPVDDATLAYFRYTGRTEEEIDAFERYFKAQGLFGMPRHGDIDYSQELALDLSTITPSLAGPKRPQDRIALKDLKSTFTELFSKPIKENGYGKAAEVLGNTYTTRDNHAQSNLCVAPDSSQSESALLPGSARNVVEMANNRPTPQTATNGTPIQPIELRHGDILIAAITSCTNTSNPSVLIAAGLLAKKAVEKGLAVKKHIKTSLAPGSRVVTEYLRTAGLLPYLEQLGFNVAGYGCTTCIGNSGPLRKVIEETVVKDDLVCAAVLSGNRNFEARIHSNIRANFLASPPLVVAYAIAGTVLRDPTSEPLGEDKDGKPVWLRDIWPTNVEIESMMKFATQAETFRRLYSDFTRDHTLWNDITSATGKLYDWPDSTYIAEPPFFEDFSLEIDQTKAPDAIHGARTLAILGNSVTTDHISPAGAIMESSPAGQYLLAHGVARADFNSYGSRRGDHRVMMRGTFANVRIRNLMVPGSEGSVTLYYNDGDRDGKEMSIFDAAMQYIQDGIPTIVFAGKEYGAGSSRDWAAKGPQLLGVKAVIAESYERIHRSNLIGMGVLPLQFKEGDSMASLGIQGDERFDILGLGDLQPQQEITLVIHSQDGSRREVRLRSRIDTAIEVDYYRHGGILQYVLRKTYA